jgi:hypothetical protein
MVSQPTAPARSLLDVLVFGAEDPIDPWRYDAAVPAAAQRHRYLEDMPQDAKRSRRESDAALALALRSPDLDRPICSCARRRRNFRCAGAASHRLVA